MDMHMTNLPRIFRHLISTRHQVRKAFPPRTLAAIGQAIQRAEAQRIGEIRFVVEAALDGPSLLLGQSARERAIEVFAQLRIWDTQHRTGILIYLLMSDHQIEIVADRGIDAHVGTEGWASLCSSLEAAFKRGEFEQGAIACIDAVAQKLLHHFPDCAPARNELPDAPVML